MSAGGERKAPPRAAPGKGLDKQLSRKRINRALQCSLCSSEGSARGGKAQHTAPTNAVPLLQLRVQEDQSQGLQRSLAQLQEELGATRAREQQGLQQLSGAKETIQDLQQEVASSRKHEAELLRQVRAQKAQP